MHTPQVPSTFFFARQLIILKREEFYTLINFFAIENN